MLTEREYTQAAERYLDMIYRIALNWFRRPPDAEDAAQEVMLRLWRTDTAFESEEHLRRWLVKVTVNECKRISLRPWRQRSVPLEACIEPAFEDTAQRELFDAVMALPGKYRVPLYLYYYEELSTQEIADVLGRSPSTVRTQLSRAREQLKTMLLEEWSDA